ncbi:glycosyltransferase family 4 protein, partial [Candidatus Roizmanbacteria bacterium]|nr:glycosyltransferase family 4 protein [Candidatus Roizmanbacteria bacterium]
LKNRLETMIRRDGVADRVRIRKLAYEDMASVYRENDLLLFPSKQTSTWEEQYGMVLLEAMASGLPIFGYDSGAVGAVVGRAGALSRASRPDGLVKLIKAAVRGNGLKKLASFSRRRAEQLYDSRKTAKTIGTIYKEVANYERK